MQAGKSWSVDAVHGYPPKILRRILCIERDEHSIMQTAVRNVRRIQHVAVANRHSANSLGCRVTARLIQGGFDGRPVPHQRDRSLDLDHEPFDSQR